MILGIRKLGQSARVDLLFITKMLQTIQEQLWNHPGNILFMSIWDSKIKKFEKVCPMYHVCFVLKCWVPKCLQYMFFEDEDRKMLHFPFIESSTSWILISYLSKT